MRHRYLNLPNIISFSRLIIVPLIIWLILTYRIRFALYLFISAGVSDILDGLLARLLKKRTKIGAYLDPIADKALLVGVFITLAICGYLPIWIVILVVFRDVIIIIGPILSIILNKSFKVKPLWIGKLNTFLQMLLISLVLSKHCTNFVQTNMVKSIMYIMVITTSCSGLSYMKLWVRAICRKKV